MYPDPHRTMAIYFSILVPFFRKWSSIVWSTRFTKKSGRAQVPSAHTIQDHFEPERSERVKERAEASGPSAATVRQPSSCHFIQRNFKLLGVLFCKKTCRCLFPPADLRLRHLFICSKWNCSCMRQTASSRAVVIVMATFCTVCLLAWRCTCPCNKSLCISFTLLRRAGGSDRVSLTRPGASSSKH